MFHKFSIWSSWIVYYILSASVYASTVKFPYDTQNPSNAPRFNPDQMTEMGTVFDKTVINPVTQTQQDSVLYQLLKLAGVEQYVRTWWDMPAIAYVQMLINLFLGLASFVALIIIVFWFYQMMFASDQAAEFGKAQSKVRGAAIAFLILAVSWIALNFMFTFFSDVSNI